MDADDGTIVLLDLLFPQCLGRRKGRIESRFERASRCAGASCVLILTALTPF